MFTYRSTTSKHMLGNCREALAAPVEGRIFFAGEATHPAVNPCLQAAYETGQRAAQELLASLSRSRL